MFCEKMVHILASAVQVSTLKDACVEAILFDFPIKVADLTTYFHSLFSIILLMVYYLCCPRGSSQTPVP